VRGGNTGLELSGTGFTVERMRIENTTSVGILIEGANSVIRNNVVGGVTDGTSQCCAYGIYANGAFARVSDNEVLDTGVGRTGESEAIKVVVSPGAVIERNLIANSVKTTGFYPLGIMFLASGGSKATITGNRFSNFGTAAYASVAGTALLLDNVVANATTPFVGGVIQGGTTNYTY
jgi:Right handed beta helix region